MDHSSDLAVAATPPGILPLAKPWVGQDEQAACARVLASGALAAGGENALFEAEVAHLADRHFGIAAANGTAALELAFAALDLPRPGTVVVPAATFPAPANVASLLGFTVVAADVDPLTWNISAQSLSSAIGPDTVAVVAVDLFGFPVSSAVTLAARGIPVIDDAAGAIGAHTGGRPAGSLGAAGCFSFHSTKIVTTGEGGCLVLSDETAAERARLMRNHGQRAPGVFVGAGRNLRLSELQAAVGRAQLHRLSQILRERRTLARWYRDRLDQGRCRGRVGRQEPQPGCEPSWQKFTVLLPEGIDRLRVIARCRERGIETAPAVSALHRIAPYAGRPGFEPQRFPVADSLFVRGLALPLFVGMSCGDVDRVVGALEELL